MKTTNMLKKQHRLVDSLFDELERARRIDKKRALVDELGRQLDQHMNIEEEIVYPMARATGDDVRVLMNQEQHLAAREGLRRLRDAAPDDDTFVARARVLRSLVKQHIREEERELFPALDHALEIEEDVTLVSKIEEFQSRKQARGVARGGRGRRGRGRAQARH